MTLVINTHTKVTSKANRKLRAICTSSMSIALASTLSETAKETIKTISKNHLNCNGCAWRIPQLHINPFAVMLLNTILTEPL